MDKRRWIIAGSGLLIFILSILLVRSLPETDPSAKVSNGNSQTAVNTVEVILDTVQTSFAISGRLNAKENIEIFAEVGGKSSYAAKEFKSGNSFAKGELILQIDDSEFRNNLKAQKSQYLSILAQTLSDIKLDYEEEFPKWRDYLKRFNIESPLEKLPETNDPQFKLFLSGRNILTQYYKIKEAEERLSKYQIRAPFDGILTESFLNRSALVRVGQKLGEFLSNREFELEASVELEQLPYLTIGDVITFKDLNSQKTYQASLIRINGKIDPNTQLLKVYFSLNSEALRAGQYLEGEYTTSAHLDAMRINAQALIDDEVLLVENGKAVLKKVTVIQSNTNEAVISGLPQGSKLIIDKKNRAFEGTEVIEMNKD